MTTAPGRPTAASAEVVRRILERRKQRGWTREQVAEMVTRAGCPMSPAALGNIETGRPNETGQRRRQVSVDELLALADALGLTASALLPDIVGRDAPRRMTVGDLRDALADIPDSAPVAIAVLDSDGDRAAYGSSGSFADHDVREFGHASRAGFGSFYESDRGDMTEFGWETAGDLFVITTAPDDSGWGEASPIRRTDYAVRDPRVEAGP